jgi:hypothetical protein
MFNFAKKRRHRVPHHLQQQEAVHKSRMSQREMSLQEDAGRVALMMAEKGLQSPFDILDQYSSGETVPYWEYVAQFDKDYMKDVARLAKRLAKDIRKHPDRYIPKVPPPKEDAGGAGGGMGAPPGGGGAPPAAPEGGGMAPAAASSGLVKTASNDLILKRSGGNFQLEGTMAALLLGEFQFPNEEGILYAFRVKDDEVIVPRNSPSAAAAMRINSDMVMEMRNALIASLREAKMGNNADLVTQATMEDMMQRRTCDLMMMSGVIGGPSRLVAINNFSSYKVEGGDILAQPVLEPQVVENIRAWLGKVMIKYIREYGSALRADGINIGMYQEVMPRFTQYGYMQEEDHQKEVRQLMLKNNEDTVPKVLGDAEARTSADLKSLYLTMSSRDAMNEERNSAIQRVIEIVQKYPELHKTLPLEADDIDIMKNGAGCVEGTECAKAFDRLKIMLIAASADEKTIVKLFTDNDVPTIRTDLGNLVAFHKMDNAMKLRPEMAYYSYALMKSLDPTDENQLKAMITFAKTPPHWPDELSTIFINAIIKTNNQELIDTLYVSCIKYSDISSRYNRSYLPHFLMSYLYEHGDAVRGREMLRRMQSLENAPNIQQITAISTAAKYDMDSMVPGAEFAALAKLPTKAIAAVTGDGAVNYMRNTRQAWNGGKIPTANDINVGDIPINPLPLAKWLAILGDNAAMLSLLDACGRKYQSQKDELNGYALKYLASTLEANGHGQAANSTLRSVGVVIYEDDIKSIIMPGSLASSKITEQHIEDAILIGDWITAAKLLAFMYTANPQRATRLLSSMQEPQDPETFLGFLPRALAAQAPWGRETDVEAKVLLDGTVLVKKAGCYSMTIRDKETKFEASDDEAEDIAYQILAKDLGGK